MTFNYLDNIAKGKGFGIFDNAKSIIAICAKGAANYTRKQIDELTDYVKRPQIGAKGLIWCRFGEDGLKSSVDKFFSTEDLQKWADVCGASQGDLMLVLSGDTIATQKQMNELRLYLATQLGLRDNTVYSPLWVIDFPLLEWNEDAQRFFAMHHPFTAPNPEDTAKLDSAPASVNANAYDLVINGVEVGGGSVRIFDKELQSKMFKILGFTPEEAQKQFGFLMNAFDYGAPPHAGIAFGFDRLCSLFGGSDSIRDFIAFPKNNKGRDVMIDAPSSISQEQLKELNLHIAESK
jgi:aspartyl-tRNA synthetase